MHRFLIALLLALAAVPATADAATVTFDPTSEYVKITAAPGETNHVSVEQKDFKQTTITDTGAPLTATGAPCANVDANTVVCKVTGEDTCCTVTQVDLGDGDDTFKGSKQFSTDYIDAGPGDDVIDGGDKGYDTINGGGGRDTLTASTGAKITDGDTADAIDADVMKVENGTIDYSSRIGDVRVDLVKGTGGEEGEGDTVEGFDRATTGAGNDRIAGTKAANILEGGDGDDLLIGRGGKDHNDFGDDLYGGKGDDRLYGDKGNESFYGQGGTDSYRCRGGQDSISRPGPAEFIGAACERAYFDVPGKDADSFGLNPNPLRFDGRTATFTGECISYEIDEGEPPSCSGKVTLRHATGSKGVLGRGGYKLHERDSTKYAITLTAKGRKLAARKKGVVVTVHLSGKDVVDCRYTIKLGGR